MQAMTGNAALRPSSTPDPHQRLHSGLQRHEHNLPAAPLCPQ